VVTGGGNGAFMVSVTECMGNGEGRWWGRAISWEARRLVFAMKESGRRQGLAWWCAARKPVAVLLRIAPV
jgi:hypothetical protein